MGRQKSSMKLPITPLVYPAPRIIQILLTKTSELILEMYNKKVTSDSKINLDSILKSIPKTYRRRLIYIFSSHAQNKMETFEFSRTELYNEFLANSDP